VDRQTFRAMVALMGCLLTGEIAWAQNPPDRRAQVKEAPSMASTIRELGVIGWSFDGPGNNMAPEAQRLMPILKRQLREAITVAINGPEIAQAPAEDIRTRILDSLSEQGVELQESEKGAETADEYLSRVLFVYGKVRRIEVTRPAEHPDLLAVLITLEIPCGEDSALNIYARSGRRWELVLTKESGDYAQVNGALGGFQFAISPPDAAGKWFVTTADTTPWCTSNWQGIRFNVIRPSGDPSRPKVLLAGRETIYLGVDKVMKLVAARDGFQLMFLTSQELDSDLLTRVEVEAYRVKGNSAERTAPLALEPADFIAEWVKLPWEKAAAWTRAADMKAAEEWHARLGAMEKTPSAWEEGFDFVQPCPAHDEFDRWQVGFRMGELEEGSQAPSELFFSITQEGDEFWVDDIATERPGGCPGEAPPQAGELD
jgi:hypothetical protein